MPGESAVRAAGQRDEAGALAEAVGGEGGRVDAGIQQAQVLVTELEDVGARQHPLERVAPDRDVGLDVQAQVGVVADHHPCANALDQRALRGGGVADDHRVGADVQQPRIGRHALQRLERQRAVGRAGAVERVLGHALGIDADQADRRRCGAAVHGVQRHALGAQRVHQPAAQLAVRDAAEEGDLLAHAREAEGDVQRRAADAGVERDARGRRRTREHIHQGFARDHEHACLSLVEITGRFSASRTSSGARTRAWPRETPAAPRGPARARPRGPARAT